MKVTLKLLLDYQKYLPPGTKNGAVDIDVSSGALVKDLLNSLSISSEDLNILLINGCSANANNELHEGDTVFIFSAATGG